MGGVSSVENRVLSDIRTGKKLEGLSQLITQYSIPVTRKSLRVLKELLGKWGHNLFL